jgi:hypothetical protein
MLPGRRTGVGVAPAPAPTATPTPTCVAPPGVPAPDPVTGVPIRDPLATIGFARSVVFVGVPGPIPADDRLEDDTGERERATYRGISPFPFPPPFALSPLNPLALSPLAVDGVLRSRGVPVPDPDAEVEPRNEADDGSTISETLTRALSFGVPVVPVAVAPRFATDAPAVPGVRGVCPARSTSGTDTYQSVLVVFG